MSTAARLPRYTSYPTAPHFRDLDEHAAQQALARVDGPLSVYVHVPFCKQLCWYCGCHRLIRRKKAAATPYVDDMLREIELLDGYLPPGRTIRQLALGGGTPSFLLPADLDRLLRGMTARWPRATQVEWSMELDPRSVDGDRLRELVGLGFNRFSLGVQDIDPQVMRHVNREQPKELSEELFAAARDFAEVGLSVDLMYGLPHQTESTWARTLEWAVEQGPDRLSVFPYAHVPWLQPQQKLIEDGLPGTSQRIALRDLARSTLAEAGYVRIGMDHFARADDSLAQAQVAGTLQRNFQGYSTHRGVDMLGIGASAIGSYGGIYAQNAREIPHYRDRLAQGRLPVVRGLELSADDRLRREVIVDLLCRFEVRWAEHGVEADRFESELAAPAPHVDEGLVEITEEGLRVLPAGRERARQVAAVFDAYLGEGGARYSRVD